MSKVASNWADRPHSGPGDSGAVNIHKGLAMNVSPPKPERKTRVDLGDGGPGRVHSPGWFSTKK
jgi:hypothetical protein